VVLSGTTRELKNSAVIQSQSETMYCMTPPFCENCDY
jgi:hypothetical protein